MSVEPLHTGMRFKEFVLTEAEDYFVKRVSDILNALQDLNDAANDMGARHLVSNSQTIVNQMRRIIHTHWPQSEKPNLETLQKCAVAIMKAIDEKDDLQGVLKASQAHLEALAGRQDKPANRLVSDA
jgi:F0F1-type ATP synthase beta subunit